MDELIKQFIEEAKRSKKSMRQLKQLAVSCKQYEFATQLREIENELFPDSEELKEAKKINLILRMVDLDVNEKACWIISETLKKYFEIGGEFSIREASEVIEKSKRLFDSE